MSEVPPPDWAALYQQHRDAMYRVAARVLRGAGRADEAGDAVSAAMESLMKSPPANVLNWQAVLVTAVKRRALDLLGSSAVRHEVATDASRLPDSCAGQIAAVERVLPGLRPADGVDHDAQRRTHRSALDALDGVVLLHLAARWPTMPCGSRTYFLAAPRSNSW
jgi:DNA-directed RNA polymerase specialized sigma24 family protein